MAAQLLQAAGAAGPVAVASTPQGGLVYSAMQAAVAVVAGLVATDRAVADTAPTD
jgi:hypothetical protein